MSFWRMCRISHPQHLTVSRAVGIVVSIVLIIVITAVAIPWGISTFGY